MIAEKKLVDPGYLRAHQVYKDLACRKVPGFSAISGVLNKPALIPWAWGLGRDGIDLNKAKQQAFDVGTCAHFMVECHVNGWTADLAQFSPADLDKAENSFIKFLDFWEGKFDLIASEYQMVSSSERYGGTADIIATERETGDICLIDLKTSKAVYPEYEMQLCAYKNLYDNGDITMVDGVPQHRRLPSNGIDRMICVRIGKEESGDVEVHEVKPDRYDGYMALFRRCKDILELKRELKWR